MKPIALVTGAAGFIGYHLCRKLLSSNYIVIGIDNFNNYYTVKLKKVRAAILESIENFTMVEGDLVDIGLLSSIFDRYEIDQVVNLAAQAGVRYSIENPQSYIRSNLVGFANILESCRHNKVKHLVYASSSSVYGANETSPLSESQAVGHPMSLYAATKRSNELMAHSYSSLYGLPTTGLRFFTVYGPWGRPDMALFIFTKNILEGKPIYVNNNGDMSRDFTYIDDITEGISRLMLNTAEKDVCWSGGDPRIDTSYCPWSVYNIGRGQPVKLTDFIDCIEKKLGKKAIKKLRPMQPGDVASTCADTSKLMIDTGYQPSVSVEQGIDKFVDWYLEYYKPAVMA